MIIKSNNYRPGRENQNRKKDNCCSSSSPSQELKWKSERTKKEEANRKCLAHAQARHFGTQMKERKFKSGWIEERKRNKCYVLLNKTETNRKLVQKRRSS